MNPEQSVAIPAVAVGVSVTIGVFLLARIRQGDPQPVRDGFVVAGLLGGGILLLLASGQEWVFALLLPALLAGLGAYALLSSQEFAFRRTMGIAAVAAGSLGVLLGLIRLTLF